MVLFRKRMFHLFLLGFPPPLPHCPYLSNFGSASPQVGMSLRILTAGIRPRVSVLENEGKRKLPMEVATWYFNVSNLIDFALSAPSKWWETEIKLTREMCFSISRDFRKQILTHAHTYTQTEPG